MTHKQVSGKVVDAFYFTADPVRKDSEELTAEEQSCLDWAKSRMSDTDFKTLEEALEDYDTELENIYILEYEVGNILLHKAIFDETDTYAIGKTVIIMVSEKNPQYPVLDTISNNWRMLMIGLPLGLVLLALGLTILWGTYS